MVDDPTKIFVFFIPLMKYFIHFYCFKYSSTKVFQEVFMVLYYIAPKKNFG